VANALAQLSAALGREQQRDPGADEHPDAEWRERLHEPLARRRPPRQAQLREQLIPVEISHGISPFPRGLRGPSSRPPVNRATIFCARRGTAETRSPSRRPARTIPLPSDEESPPPRRKPMPSAAATIPYGCRRARPSMSTTARSSRMDSRLTRSCTLVRTRP